MKRIVVSIGVAAIGSAACHQAQAADLTSKQNSKPWSVGMALRGFYDSNYLLAPRGDEMGSWGFEIRPTIGVAVPMEQTYLGLDFTYSGMYYADRDDDPWDNSYLFNGIFNHAFSERVTLDVKDHLVYSQRPELTDPSFSTALRTDQNNVNNIGDIQLAFGISPRLGLVVGYQNLFWDYENHNTAAETAPQGSQSLAALLNRIESIIPVNLRHQTGPSTVTFIGYSFGWVDRTSDEYLGVNPVTGAWQKADIRNNYSHYGYVGVEHNFSPTLSLGVKGGVQYTDYYNDPQNEPWTTPYGDVSLNYFYTTGSRVELGYRLSQAATDVYAPSPTTGDTTQNRVVSSVFARVEHQFLPNFHGGLYGQWQLSQYYGGAYDGEDDDLWLFGAMLRYDINAFLALDVGYKLDYRDSQIPDRGYTRNRVHFGVTASY